MLKAVLRKLTAKHSPLQPEGSVVEEDERPPVGDDGFPLTYRSDFLWTIHNADFQKEPKFQEAYAKEVKSHGQPFQKQWRSHIVIWAIASALRRHGDFVECGVHLGGSTSGALTYVDWNAVRGSRRFYLMDTFDGLRPDLMSDEEKALKKTSYVECFDIAKANLAEFEGLEFIRGAVPDTLPQNPATEIAYLHIDMNCAAPEVAAIRYFWPKLVPGAIVVLDDYAFRGFQPQKEAMDEVGIELGFTIASLPTGQGLIVK